jgi:hypothetical protein
MENYYDQIIPMTITVFSHGINYVLKNCALQLKIFLTDSEYIMGTGNGIWYIKIFKAPFSENKDTN